MVASPVLVPSLYIPHGGGPCFFMAPPPGREGLWDRMASYLRGLDAEIGVRPAAVLVVSAHWEAARPTVNANPAPSMWFDYYGFPEHTYRLSYPAPGAPGLAARVRGLLQAAGIESDVEHQRGFDHGVFVPFMLVYPDADVPIVELSLCNSLYPVEHVAIGRALSALRDEGVLIVGSGMSYHNLRAMQRGEGGEVSEVFDAWLTRAVEDPDPVRRAQSIVHWERAPGARDCHPEAEHLAPLFVVLGAAADDPGRRTYADKLGPFALSGFQFG